MNFPKNSQIPYIKYFTNQFPTLWKKANICPVFKKGDAAVVSNYRPISLLSTVRKVFERAVYVHILNHLSYNLHNFTFNTVKPSIPVKKYELSFATLVKLLIKFGTRDY